MNFSWLVVLASLSLFQPAFADETKHEIELGYQFDEVGPGNINARNRPYILAKGEYVFTDFDKAGSTFALDVAGRAWTDVDGNELSFRELALVYSANLIKITAGLQQIPWGETFGLYIADIVNPRDYRDPFWMEPTWFRLPVAALNAQTFLGPLTLQGIFTPIPRNNILPDRGGAFDPFPASVNGVPVGNQVNYQASNFPNDAEYGGHLSYLFDFGLDWGLFYFRHWNRDPAFELDQTPSGPVLTPVQKLVNSYGTTGSLSEGILVFRADSVLNEQEPVTAPDLSAAPLRDVWRTIVGSDATISDWTLGGQLHFDVTDFDDYLDWFSFRIKKKFGPHDPQLEFFVFRGINNDDLWIEPKVTWDITGSIGFSLFADFLFGGGGAEGTDPTDGILTPYNGKSRIFAWLSYSL
jgi:hypothetical protein